MASTHLSWTKHNTALRIIFSKLYMESGFFLIDDGLTAQLGSSANVFYSSASQGILISDGDYPDQGRVTVNPDAVPPNEILKGEDLPSGFRSKSMLLTELISLGTWQARRDCLLKCPPSVYSGKLRMLVQSLYGAKRFDYQYSGSVGGLDIPRITWGSELLNPYLEHGHFSFLVTTSDYDYFLAKLNGSSLQLIELKLSGQAELLKETLKLLPKYKPVASASDYAARIEAYMLSTAAITSKSKRYTCSLTPVEGLPLYYGWHMEWDGLKGYIIKHVQDVNYGESPPSYKVLSKECELTISYTKDLEGNYTFSASETLKASKHWSPVYAWVQPACPDPSSGQLLNLHYARFTTPGMYLEPITYSNVPLYCYLDKDDVLQKVVISSSIEQRSGNFDSSPPTLYPCGDEPIPNQRKGTYIAGAAQGSASITVDGLTIEITFEGVSSVVETEWQPNPTIITFLPNQISAFPSDFMTCDGQRVGDLLVATGNFSNPNSNQGNATGITFSSPCPNYIKYERYLAGYQNVAWAPTTKVFTDDVIQTAHAIIIVPWDSCEAVGVVSESYSGPKYFSAYNLDAAISEGYATYKILQGKTHNDPCEANFSVPAYDISELGINTIGNAMNPFRLVGAPTSSSQPSTYATNYALKGCFNSLPSTTGSGGSSYFQATYVYPTINVRDSVKNTLLGSVKTYTGYPDYDPVSDWPTEGQVQVGWV